MHTLAHCICLWIFVWRSHIFDSIEHENALEITTSEFRSMIMDASKRPRVSSERHSFSNFIPTWAADLLLILINSVRFVTGSMHVRAWKTSSCPLTWIFHLPMRSRTATSSHGARGASQGGKVPYPGPTNLYLWQVSHAWTTASTVSFNCGW
jgi:hypothetical protein